MDPNGHVGQQSAQADAFTAADQGQVMTKRAIRRRIVKNWERKQKELRAAAAADGNNTEEAVLDGRDPQPTPTLAGGAGGTVTPTPWTGTNKKKREQHPLRCAAGGPQGVGSPYGARQLPERDPRTAFLRGGLAAPGVPPPFEFFFRVPPGTSLHDGNAPAPPLVDGAAGSMRYEDHDDAHVHQASRCAVVDESFMAMVTRSAHRGRTDRGDASHPEDGAAERPSAVLPIPSAFSPPSGHGGGAGPPAFRPIIRRVERQEPMPLAPFSPGTDLNTPTQNYLSLDALWGVHRHAPGFYRESDAATTTLLTAAARVLADDGRAVNVISTGDAMTRLFESSYRQDQPFTLHVHRIGPAVVLRAPTDSAPEHTIEQVRKKALLSKALYRIRDAAVSAGGGRGSDAASAAVAASAVALRGDAPRAGSLTFATRVQQDPNLHAYSNILQWGIQQSLEVLIGMDTPVLVDHDHDNMELTLALHDAMSGSELSSPSSVQLDALRCWFESTLANVAHVGFCVHNRGVVQSYQIKKVTELLTMAEAQVATSAMGFTTSALKWLMEHCVDDGTDYAVIRNSDTNMLELYALHGSVPQYNESEEDEDVGEDRQQPQGAIPGRGPRASGAPSPTPTSPCPHNDSDTGGTTQRERCGGSNGTAPDMTLAILCYKMAVHLSMNGKPSDALRLFFRSFQILHLHADEREAAVAPLVDICMRLGKLVEDVLSERLPATDAMMRTAAAAPAEAAVVSDEAAAAHQQKQDVPKGTADAGGSGGRWNVSALLDIPEMFQESLFTCMRMEDRAKQLYEKVLARGRRRRDARAPLSASHHASAHDDDMEEGPLSIAAAANMLLRCGAAISTVVGKCLDWWVVLRQRLRVLKKAVVHRQRDSVVQLHTIAYKELIQVVLEGIATLEGIALCFFPTIDPLNPQQQHMHNMPCASLLASSGADRRHGGGIPSDGDSPGTDPSTAIALPDRDCRGALMVELSHLSLAICELMGDVHFNAAADASPTTASAVAEISGCMVRRQHRRTTMEAPMGSVERNVEGGLHAIHDAASSRSSDAAAGVPIEGTTCLRRLAQVTSADVVVHFHEAMRYYAKQKMVTRRLTAKIARLYYTVGVHYRDTDRWTKALENLRLCEDVLASVVHAPCDAIYAACTQQCVLHISDVKHALGSVLLHMAMFRWDQSLRSASNQGKFAQLFIPSGTHGTLLNTVPMRYDEEKLWSSCIDAFDSAVQRSTMRECRTAGYAAEGDHRTAKDSVCSVGYRCVAQAIYAIRCTQRLALLSRGGGTPHSNGDRDAAADVAAPEADITATLEHTHATLLRHDELALEVHDRYVPVVQRWLCLAHAQLVTCAAMLATTTTDDPAMRAQWAPMWTHRALLCAHRAQRLGCLTPPGADHVLVGGTAVLRRYGVVLPPSDAEVAVQIMVMLSGASCAAMCTTASDDAGRGGDAADEGSSTQQRSLLAASMFDTISATPSCVANLFAGDGNTMGTMVDVLLLGIKDCVRWATGLQSRHMSAASSGRWDALVIGLKNLMREVFVFRHDKRNVANCPDSPSLQAQDATRELILSISARVGDLYRVHKGEIASCQ